MMMVLNHAVIFLLCFLLDVAVVASCLQHFAGGCLTYRFLETSNFKIQITATTTWNLTEGPCGPTCSTTNIGQSTETSRKKAIAYSGDEMYFGNWTAEIKGYNRRMTVYRSLLNKTKTRMTSRVSGVNQIQHWEQEVAYLVLDIDRNCKETDISIDGKHWRPLDYEPAASKKGYHLQVSVKPLIRSDTGKPNNSPLVLFRPVYKVSLNRKTRIRLATADPDGDTVKCRYARFVQAGYLDAHTNISVSENCEITFEPYIGENSSTYAYKHRGWGAIPVTVSDFSKKTIQLTREGKSIQVGKTWPLSSVNAQFLFQTLKNLKIPEFVEPTKPNNHKYKVYVGSTLKIKLYAKPNETSKEEIDSFYVLSLPHRTFNVCKAESAYSTLNTTKFCEFSWPIKTSDVGTFILQAIASDTAGVDSEERTYIVSVEDINFTQLCVTQSHGPYFVFIPSVNEVRCEVNTSCVFPVYAACQSGHTVKTVTVVNSTVVAVSAGQITEVKKSGKHVFKSDISVLDTTGGSKKICLKTTDDQKKQFTMCLNITIHSSGENCRLVDRAFAEQAARHGTVTCSCICLQTGELKTNILTRPSVSNQRLLLVLAAGSGGSIATMGVVVLSYIVGSKIFNRKTEK